MKYIAAILAVVFLGTMAMAQSASLSFGGLNIEGNEPLEMAADSLSIDQNTGSAVFDGNVNISQGGLRLQADRVEVEYNQGGGIKSLLASGGVTMVTNDQAAEAQRAEYSLGAQTLVLTGNVLVTQAQSAISADKMRVNLAKGSAVMEGRVRTILQSQDAN